MKYHFGDKRRHRVAVNLNDEEYGMITELAPDVTLAEYLRSIILEKYLEMKKEEK